MAFRRPGSPTPGAGGETSTYRGKNVLGSNDLGYVNLQGSVPPPRTKTNSLVAAVLLVWGVILPAAALVLETQSHFCARNFFDPLPTSWHGLLFALVPFTNFLAWCSLKWDMSPHYAFMLFCNGMAVGVAILYTLMFLPITHISIGGILLFGVGLLGLAPMLSLLCLIKTGRVLAGKSEGVTYFNPHHVEHLGHLLVLTAIIAVETPSTFTRIALGMASKPETEQQGLDLLRSFGNTEVMLRACYERSGRATDIVGSLYESKEHLPIEKARNLFYRVTGRTFNSFPLPDSARATMRNAGFLVDDGVGQTPDDEFDLDPDIAGEMVSGVSRGLSVCKSQMKGIVDADAAVAKFDWYLDFNNKSKFDREIRTRIKLPHAGVVTKASLIVNGKEYEAQITVKSLAREVYRAAVAQKRNPLLVSTCGIDTVLLQAFPVPPKNMRDVKLHVAMVAPLELNEDKQGIVVLPRFEERNFQISAPYNITIESNNTLNADFPNHQAVRDSDHSNVLVGELDPTKLASGNGIIRATRSSDHNYFYTPDPLAGQGSIASETITEETVACPARIVLVIDGSAGIGAYLDSIADTLRFLPTSAPLTVLFSQDGKRHQFNGRNVSPGALVPLIDQLKHLTCVGGQMNDKELNDALSLASEANTAVVWIHGPQPGESSYGHWLQQQASETLVSSTLYDMQIISGPDQLLDGLETSKSVKTVPHIGRPADDLKFLFDSWSGRVAPLKISRTSQSPVTPAPPTTVVPSPTGAYVEGSPHPVAPQHVPAQQAPSGHERGVSTRQVGDLTYSTFDHAPPAVSSSANNIVTTNGETPVIECSIATKPVPQTMNLPPDARKTMPELAQLRAYDQIMADLLKGDDQSKLEAIELAGKYHIVTPMSSAILVTDIPDLRVACPEVADETRDFLANTYRNVVSELTALNRDRARTEAYRRRGNQSKDVECYPLQQECKEEKQHVYRQNVVLQGGSNGTASMPSSMPSASSTRPGFGPVGPDGHATYNAKPTPIAPAAPKAPMTPAPSQQVADGECVAGGVAGRFAEGAEVAGEGTGGAGDVGGVVGKLVEKTQSTKAAESSRVEISNRESCKLSVDDRMQKKADAPHFEAKEKEFAADPSKALKELPIRNDSGLLNEKNATNLRSQTETTTQLDSDEQAQEEPLVPESDTWLLLAATAGTLGFVLWRTRRIKQKA